MHPMTLLVNALRGFAMGAADIVPGVSGGTIALFLGIYERLIASIRTGARSLGRIIKGDVSGFVTQLKAIEWTLIGPLLAGVAVAFVALASIIDRLLVDEPQAMAGLFFGLVVASIMVAWRLLDLRDGRRMAVLVVVAVAAFFVLGLRSGVVVDPPAIAFLLSGAVAICAMILPGISGSFLLLMLGMYTTFVGAVHDREVTNLTLFAIGAVIGLASFSTLLSWVLANHRDTLLAGLIGLMAGSLRVLWPWPNGVGVIESDAGEQVSGTELGWPADVGELWLPVVLGVVAFAVVLVLDRLAPTDSSDIDGIL